MTIRGGMLKHSIHLQRRAVTQEATYGSQNATWTTYATVFAAIEPLSGRELLSAQAVQSEITHNVTIYWTPTLVVAAADRILYGTRIFDIKSVANKLEENREIVIQAAEGLTQG